MRCVGAVARSASLRLISDHSLIRPLLWEVTGAWRGDGGSTNYCADVRKALTGTRQCSSEDKGCVKIGIFSSSSEVRILVKSFPFCLVVQQIAVSFGIVTTDAAIIDCKRKSCDKVDSFHTATIKYGSKLRRINNFCGSVSSFDHHTCAMHLSHRLSQGLWPGKI